MCGPNSCSEPVIWRNCATIWHKCAGSVWRKCDSGTRDGKTLWMTGADFLLGSAASRWSQRQARASRPYSVTKRLSASGQQCPRRTLVELRMRFDAFVGAGEFEALVELEAFVVVCGQQ